MVESGLTAATPIAVASLASAKPDTADAQSRDLIERVCETQTVLGSHLAIRRACATGTEFAERKQRERDVVDRTQMQRWVVDPAAGMCS